MRLRPVIHSAHHGAKQVEFEIRLLGLDQRVHAVQRHAAVVADDAAAAVAVGQAREDARLARSAHLIRVRVEHACVVRLAHVRVHPLDLRRRARHFGAEGAVARLHRLSPLPLAALRQRRGAFRSWTHAGKACAGEACLGVGGEAVALQRGLDHVNAAQGLDGALQRRVRL